METQGPPEAAPSVIGSVPVQLANRLRAWRRASVNRRIFAAAALVGVATIVVKAAAFGKDLVVASRFGVGDALDAFLIAAVLPSYVSTVLVGSVPAALVPAFIRVREQEGPEAAARLVLAAARPLLLLLIVASVLLYLAAPVALPLLGSGFEGEKLGVARNVLVWLLPTVVLSGVATICVVILNADDQFLLAAAVPAISPVVLLAALVGFGRTWGVYALVAGTVAGAFLETAVLVRSGAVRRVLARWRDAAGHVAAAGARRQYGAAILGATLVSATGLVDQSMAATLGPGNVSTLFFGQKLVASLSGIGILALSTAVLPHLSRLVATNDWAGIRNTLRTYARLIALVTVPAVLAMAYFSEPIVRLLFERGEFSATDTAVVARVQAVFVLQVPFHMLGILGVRLLSAMGRNHLLVWVSLLNLIVNTLGNYVLMSIMGISGIALATTVVYMVSSVAIFVLTSRAVAERIAALRDAEAR